MKLQKHLWLLCLLAAFTSTTQAQVTIGSENPPISGALLDLKEDADGKSSK